MNHALIHEKFVPGKYSIKILVGISAMFCFQLFSIDISDAYIQSTEHFTRDVFIEPNKEFNLKTDDIIILL